MLTVFPPFLWLLHMPDQCAGLVNSTEPDSQEGDIEFTGLAKSVASFLTYLSVPWGICQYCDVILLCVLLVVSESTHSLISWSGSDISLCIYSRAFYFSNVSAVDRSILFLSISSHPVFHPFPTSALAYSHLCLLIFFLSLSLASVTSCLSPVANALKMNRLSNFSCHVLSWIQVLLLAMAHKHQTAIITLTTKWVSHFLAHTVYFHHCMHESCPAKAATF